MSEQTIAQTLDEVVTEMCDKYCKYPHEIENEDDLYAICEDCPLNKLV